MRVVVTGASGQLGAVLVHEFQSHYDVVGFSHRELNIGDDAAVNAAIDRARPQVILNAAAHTDVDGCEDHPIDALNANAFGVRALARAAQRHAAVLVHYSTDFVFDGTATQPYTEQDQPNPRSVYSHSKLLGEWFALDAVNAYVLRVESLFGGVPDGPVPRGSVASIVNTLRAGGSPKVFVDRTVSPTYAIDAARATRSLVERQAPFGIYHCVNSGHATWFEFARELARQMGIAASFTPMRLADVTLKAARPQYCALSNGKLRSAGIEMPSWHDAVARFLQGVQDQLPH